MQEKLYHKEVFELYYAMGSSRSLLKLQKYLMSDKCPVNVRKKYNYRTLRRWARAFNWQYRIQQRDIEIGKKIEKKTNKEVLNSKADYRKEISDNLRILKAGIRKALIPVIENGKKKVKIGFDINNANDLSKLMNAYEKLVRLDLDLLGEGSANTESLADFLCKLVDREKE